MEKRLEPIVDMIRKIKVCIFVEEGRVPDAVLIESSNSSS